MDGTKSDDFVYDTDGNLLEYKGAADKLVVSSSFAKQIGYTNTNAKTLYEVGDEVCEILWREQNNVKVIVIENSIRLGCYAFANWDNLRAIQFNSSKAHALSYVNNYDYQRMFYGCDNLKYVKLPYAMSTSTGRAVDYIQSGCFRNCFALENIQLTPVAESNTTYEHIIRYGAFTKTAVRELVIPEHVKTANEWFAERSYATGTYNVHYYNDAMTFVRAVSLMSSMISGSSSQGISELIASAQKDDFAAFKAAITGSFDAVSFADSLQFAFIPSEGNDLAGNDCITVSNGTDTFVLPLKVQKSVLTSVSVENYPINEDFEFDKSDYTVNVPYSENKVTVNTVDVSGNATKIEYDIVDNKITVKTTNTSGTEIVYNISVNRYFTKTASQLVYLNNYVLGKTGYYSVDVNTDGKSDILDIVCLKKLIIADNSDLKNPFDIHTDLQKAFLSDTLDSILKYADGNSDLSSPKPVPLKWEPVSGAVSYILTVSENSDLSDAWIFATTKANYDLYNCKTGTKYYYRADAIMSGGSSIEGALCTFETADGIRNIYVNGITNMRDLGGNKSNGVRIKQGLIYRSGRYNENYSTVPKVTSAGVDTLLNQLHIKSEIDLRKAGENGKITNSVIPSVNYLAAPMVSSVFDDSNKDSIKSVFEFLADENNYPVVFHCSIGTDRTGFIAFLVNGLLGESLEDLQREYLFSNFGYIAGTRNLDYMNAYVPSIQKKSGNTLSEKIENYLLNDVGVSQDDINSIKDILLEK